MRERRLVISAQGAGNEAIGDYSAVVGLAGALDCVFHGPTVAEGGACGQWGRVRVRCGGGTGDSRIAPTTGWGSWKCDTGLVVGVPRLAPVPPSISLRANGTAPAPLDSCLRRNDARLGAGMTGDGDAASPRTCPGFLPPRERRFGGVRADKCCWWRRALRQAQGERICGGGQGNHEGCPYGEVMACAGRRVLMVAEWEVPAAAGRAIRESPLRRGGGVGNAIRGWRWGCPA